MLEKKLAAGVAIAVLCLAGLPLAAHGVDDTDPPSISDVGWQPQHPNDSESITITASVTDESGVAWVKLVYCYEGSCYPPVSMSGSSGFYTATIGPFEEGTLSFHITAQDTAGNTGQTQEYSLFIDGTPPSIALISPNGGEYLSGTVDIVWSVNDNRDNHPDIEVSYRNNGGWQTVESIHDAHVNEVSWDTTAVADGTDYWAKITAVDDAGNTAEDVSDSNFTVDNTPPYTTVDLDGEKNGEWFVSNVTVRLNASDNTSGVSRVFYRIDNGTWNTYNTSFEVEENGEHIISYYSVDRAGNEEDGRSLAVNIDKQGPALTMVKPQEGYFYLGGKEVMRTLSSTTVIVGDIHIEVNATDKVSGIDIVEFYVNDELKNATDETPYRWLWDDPAFFMKTLKIIAYNNAGSTAEKEIKTLVFKV